MKTTEKLNKIVKKYSEIKFNEDNYSIGGGLSDGAFASNRHQDAKYDAGKLTEGQACQLFKKATGLELDYIKEVINYAVPNMEWHHAGKLPKSYGGGMKKTYFLNAAEIVDIATNWSEYCDKLDLSKAKAREEAALKNNLEERRLAFLNENATKKTRVTSYGKWFHKAAQEMNGKYGWFDSTYKSYNMTEYFTGWEFESQEKYNEFLNIK